MLAEYFHDASLSRNVIIAFQDLSGEGAVGHVEYSGQAIRSCLIGSEQAEIVSIGLDYIAQIDLSDAE